MQITVPSYTSINLHLYINIYILFINRRHVRFFVILYAVIEVQRHVFARM